MNKIENDMHIGLPTKAEIKIDLEIKKTEKKYLGEDSHPLKYELLKNSLGMATFISALFGSFPSAYIATLRGKNVLINLPN